MCTKSITGLSYDFLGTKKQFCLHLVVVKLNFLNFSDMYPNFPSSSLINNIGLMVTHLSVMHLFEALQEMLCVEIPGSLRTGEVFLFDLF